MSLRARLRSTVARWLMSPNRQRLRRSLYERWRKLRARPHVVTAFLDAADPYSYLLCSYLEELQDHYYIRLRIVIAPALKQQYRPAPALYDRLARQDVSRLATELGLPFRDGEPLAADDVNAWLATVADSDRLECAGRALRACWNGDEQTIASVLKNKSNRASKHAQRTLQKNQRLLKRMGHYETAMLHYAGEWYGGVMRLHYLVARLDSLGVARRTGLAPRIAAIASMQRLMLPARTPDIAPPPIELFISFRSPYSWLGLQRFFAIADAFGAELVIRPVLPMVMRGLAVPQTKIRYILQDVAREARLHGVVFDRMLDPVGAGVERLMAASFLAIEQGQGREFVLAAGRAVWQFGVDLTTDDGLRSVTDSVGLRWSTVAAALQSEDWRRNAEENRAVMMAAGSWGVPTVRVDDWACWGQDRDWLLARRLDDLTSDLQL